MAVRLKVKLKGELGAGATVESVQVDAEVILLGRDPTCQVVLPQQAVSRSHARISRDEALFFIEDLGSSFGTLVNGRPLPQTPAPEVSPDAFWEGEERERYLVRNDPAAAPASQPVPDSPPTLLGPGEWFLLGDHRGKSLDSRTFGPVRLDDLIGPATYVLWPLSRFGPVRSGGAR